VAGSDVLEGDDHAKHLAENGSRRRPDDTSACAITVAQGVAAACAVSLTCGLAGIGWRSVHWADRFGELAARFATRRVDFASASTLAMEHALPLVLALAVCLVLAPLALYITLADD
jgi:hypothetical protein